MNCANCKHWNQDVVRTGWELSLRSAAAPEAEQWERTRDLENLYGRCEAIQLQDSYEVVAEPPPLALLRDGSNYRADLYTRAEFGCSLHAPVGLGETE